jgi:ABC-type antimicrobial peptide transport system permease subunit
MALDSAGKEEMLTYEAPTVARVMLTTIAIFILILAAFNYINISVVSATSRLKEIGLRKTIGGTRKQIIQQFLFENTVLCLLAFIFGILLTIGFLLPGFNNTVEPVSPMELEFENPRLWMYMVGLFLIVSIGSAAYPAFFISSFKPVQIFKGDLKLSSKNYFTKTLLGVQLIMSFITISLGVIFVLNEKYIAKRDWGYNQEQSIIVPLVKNDQYSELKNLVSQNNDVKIISGSQNHMGYWAEEDAVEFESEKYVGKKIMVGYDYLDVLGFRLKAGRFFETNSTTDLNESLVVNETFVKKLGLENPVGTRVVLDNQAHYIIGVVQDFHYMSFAREIKPLFFKVVDESNFNFLAIRSEAGKAVIAEEFVEDAWKKMYPDYTYEGFFQSNAFDYEFRENKRIAKLMMGIAGITILIACMGLFGLVSLFISKKMNEFSIRKVLGATYSELSVEISKGFMWVIGIACIIGAPLAFFATKSVLSGIYSYHVPINAVPLIFTALVLIITAISTVSSQIFKGLRVNPVEQLRDQ